MSMLRLAPVLIVLANAVWIIDGQTTKAAGERSACGRDEVLTTMPCKSACEMACPPPRKVAPACPDRCYQPGVFNERTEPFGRCMCTKGMYRRLKDAQCVPLDLCTVDPDDKNDLNNIAKQLLEEVLSGSSAQENNFNSLSADVPKGVLTDAFYRVFQRFMAAMAAVNIDPNAIANLDAAPKVRPATKSTQSVPANDVPSTSNANNAAEKDRLDSKQPAPTTGQKESSIPLAHPKCKLPIHVGEANCVGKKRTVRYAYDVASEGCRAFGYSGCGGNQNNFASLGRCQNECFLQDGGGECAFGEPPLKSDKTDEPVYCGTHPSGAQARPDACGPAHRCRMGAFFGLCCPKRTEELSSASTSDKCRNGKTAVGVKYDVTPNDWETTLVGSKCSHNFCPDNTVCEQRQLTAVCCPK